jgi:hypothetical protein
MRELSFKKLLKGLQVAIANVGNSPVIEVGVKPMEQVVTLTRHGLPSFGRAGCWRPNKQINEMLAPLVNQSCCRVVIEVIKAAADQWKTLITEIHDRGCEIELYIEPRFNGMLIGRSHIGQMIGQE